MDELFDVGLTNAVTASVFALIVFGITRLWRNEKVAHVLWLMVLLKFIIPPILNVPIELPSRTDSASNDLEQPVPVRVQSDRRVATSQPKEEVDSKPGAVSDPRGVNRLKRISTDPQAAAVNGSFQIPPIKSVLLFIWCAGTAIWLVQIFLRIHRFRRIVGTAQPASANVCQPAQAESKMLGLARCPEIRQVEMDVSPVIWSVFCRPILLLPSRLVQSLTPQQLRTVLAHELAHVRRRDHWLRWIEIPVVALHWWNPVVWWVRREWRLAEEICCDACVVGTNRERTEAYSEALLATVEFVAGLRRTIPAMALGIGQKNHLKRRLEMILENRHARRFTWRLWLSLAMFGIVCLPLSLIVVARNDRDGAYAGAGSAGTHQQDAERIEVPGTDAAPTVPAEVKDEASPGRSVRTIAFSPHGRMLAGGSVDGMIRLWATDGRLRTTMLTIKGHKGWVQAIHFSADGTTMLTAGQSVKQWNSRTRKLKKRVELDLQGHKRIAQLFKFSPDGRMLAGHLRGGASTLTVWDAESGAIQKTFDLVGIPLDAAFSPDGRLLAVGTIALRENKSTGAVQILDAKLGTTKRTIKVHPYSMSAVAFSPNGKVVAGGDHRKVRLWNVDTGELQQQFVGHSGVIESLAFSPDGRKLASGAQGPVIRFPKESVLLSEAKIWDLEKGRLISSRAGEMGRTNGIAFSPDGRSLARCDDVSVVWEELEGVRSWTKYFASWPTIGERIE